METIYYRLNATRITAGAQKASGGESLRCVVLPQAPRAGGAARFPFHPNINKECCT